MPLQSLFWRSEKHEVDFVRRGRPWIEVKAGHASPFEFDWFVRNFSREKLLVGGAKTFAISPAFSQTRRGLNLPVEIAFSP